MNKWSILNFFNIRKKNIFKKIFTLIVFTLFVRFLEVGELEYWLYYIQIVFTLLHQWHVQRDQKYQQIS